jgi:hypothetical protein
MEFVEAPAFTRHLARYLDDEQYRGLQEALATAPELGDVMPERAASASYDGRTFAGAKAVAVGCG